MDFDALVDVADADGRLLSTWQRGVKRHGTEDVERYGGDDSVCMVLSPFSCCHSSEFAIIPDALDGAVESVGQTLSCKRFVKESDGKA